MARHNLRIIEKLYAKSKKPAELSPVKIAFLGDSITHGCFEVVETTPGEFDCIYDHKAVYHERLKHKLAAVFPNSPVNVINAGISGSSAEQGADRLRRDVISTAPDLAVICFGLNDVVLHSKDNYLKSLSRIFSELRINEIDTIFLTPNMMCTYQSPNISAKWLSNTSKKCSELQNNGKMDDYMNGAREVALREQVLLCDCYEIWKNLELAGADITNLLANYINHPKRELHDIFANELFNTILMG